jgi:dTDP-4-dehydrorhamnose 3,5-epimerase
MDIVELAIPDVKLLTPRLFHDSRGWFQETYSQRALAAIGLDPGFVQDNHSLSLRAGTVRGLHFQVSPMAQDKLVRVLRGAIFDVALDIRPDSPTFGRHVSARLDADNRRQIWIPKGFAHGFCTLEAHTEVLYKVTAPYAPEHEHGCRWNDPDLGIAWPIAESDVVMSDKDRDLPCLRELERVSLGC